MTSCRKVLFSLYALSLFTSMAGMEIFSWSLFLLAIAELLRTRDFKALKLGIDPIIWGFVAIVGVSLYLHTESPAAFMEYFGDMRWVFLLYTFTFLLRKSEVVPDRGILWAMVVGIMFAGLYGLFQFLTGLNPTSSHRILAPAGDFFRATGFFSMPLTFGYSLGMGGLLLFGLSNKQASTRKKMLLYAAISAAILGVMVSLTRGAWVSAVICFTGFGVMQFGMNRVWKYLAGFLVLLALILVSSESLRLRVASIVDTQNHSNNVRFNIWRANFAMFKDHPILGIGFGQNKKSLPEYYAKTEIAEDFVGHAHSNYMQFLSGTGLLGLFCYLFMCFYFLRLAYQLWKTQGVYSGLGLGSFWAQMYMHIGGLTECNFTDGEVTHMVVLCWALVAAAAYKVKGVKI